MHKNNYKEPSDYEYEKNTVSVEIISDWVEYSNFCDLSLSAWGRDRQYAILVAKSRIFLFSYTIYSHVRMIKT